MDISPFVRVLVRWVHEPTLLAATAVGSLLLMVLGLLGVPWWVVRLPADYFAGEARPPGALTPGLRGLVLRGLKNVAGAILLLLGVAMLLLPGQGLVTILVAVGLLDFPGKWRFERRLVSLGPVLHVINRIRARAGRPPLALPDEGSRG